MGVASLLGLAMELFQEYRIISDQISPIGMALDDVRCAQLTARDPVIKPIAIHPQFSRQAMNRPHPFHFARQAMCVITTQPVVLPADF